MKHLRKFDNQFAFDAGYGEMDFPCVVLVGEELLYLKQYTPMPDSAMPLYIQALDEDITVQFSTNAIQYSLDNSTWVDLAADTSTPTIAAGNKVYFRATGLSASSTAGIGTFSATGLFAVGGNAMSMLYGAEYVSALTIEQSYALASLFAGSSIVEAHRLSLPAMTLMDGCYYRMFYQCSELMTSPQLPALTLAKSCYSNMYRECIKLPYAVELPATNLNHYCYSHMYDGCIALKAGPSILPATSSDHTGPYCYMFYSCKTLTHSPDIQLRSLSTYSSAMEYMFTYCSNLRYIKAMFTKAPSSSFLASWVQGVSAAGTFVKNSAATWSDTFGSSAIPSGWTVETAEA